MRMSIFLFGSFLRSSSEVGAQVHRHGLAFQIL